MPLQIITPTPADAPTLSRMAWNCYEDTPAAKAMISPSMERSKLEQWTVDSMTSKWATTQNRVVKDTDTGEFLSSLGYTFAHKENGESWKKPPNGKTVEKAPEGVSKDLYLQMQVAIWQQRVAVMGAEQFIWLVALCTDPKHQRKGAGKMLLHLVVAEAEKRNLPVYLTATAAGYKLYRSCGFEDKGAFPVHEPTDGPPSEKFWAMVRPTPRPGKPTDFPELPRRPVKILPLDKTREKVREMLEVSNKAFGGNPLTDLCFEKVQETMDERADKDMVRIVKDEYMFHKAVDPEDPHGPILGAAKWLIVEDPHQPINPFGDGWPRGVNQACLDASLGKLEKFRDQYYRERNRPFVYMASLTILPDAQRRGIGSALLREGLAEADRRGLETFIDASPSGLGLYKKFGWEEVYEVTVNLKPFGGDDTEETMVSLIRKPGAKEKKPDAKGGLPIVPAA